MSLGNIKGFYYSSVFQTLIIAVATLFLYFSIGSGIFGDTQDSSGDGENPSVEVIQFNGYVILYVILGLIFGSILFYFIFTKLRDYGIRIVYTIVLGFSFVLFIWELISLVITTDLTLLAILGYSVLGIVVAVFAIIFLKIYLAGKGSLGVRNAGIILSAVIIGRMMALYFDLLSIVFFALILGLFDIYSVFRGPLSKVMGKPRRRDENMVDPTQEQLAYQFQVIANKGTPVIMSFQNTILGIGDVLFFSILMYSSLIEWYLVGMLVTTLAITLGSIGTLLLLQKLSPLPGLPLPVSLSLIGYVGLSIYY